MRKSRPLSLPRKLILKNRRIFPKLYKEGIRLKKGPLLLFYRISSDRPFRVGFSTGKQFTKAVSRNRARRLMREAFRLHQREVRKGMDYIFVWVGSIEGVTMEQVEKRLLALLEEAGLLRS